MDNNTEALLRELADKFGTTTEKLYGVLVKQAKVEIIQSIIGAIACIVLIFIGIHFLGLVHYSEGKVIKTEYSVDTIYPSTNILFIIAWIANGILWIISVFVIVENVNSIVSNFMNPEYQALEKILDSVSSKS